MLPQPGSSRRLLELAGRVLVTPLDHLRPLWEAYLIGGLARRRAALLFKLHHSIIDGVGSMMLFETLTQAHRADEVSPARRPPHRSDDKVISPIRSGVLGQATDGLGFALASAGDAALHPLRTVRQLVRNIGELCHMIREFQAHAITDPLADPHGGVGSSLDFAEISLPRLRRIKAALGVTLNDLLLAAVAGAVGRYHDRCGAPIKEVQCVVSVNVRQADERAFVGNRVGAFILPLPVGEHDSLRRLEKISNHTSVAKGNGRGSGSHLLMQALAFIPGVAFRALSQTIAGKIGLICTNVPGPRTRRYLAGAKVEAIYPFLPTMFGIPLTVALLSYGDTLAVGIDTDSVCNPRLLCRYVKDELDEIERRVLPYQARNGTVRLPSRQHSYAVA